MRILRGQAVVFCAVLLVALPASCDEWPLSLHDSANTAISTEQIALPLDLVWKLEWDASEERHVQQMVSAGGRLYLADLKRVLATDLKTGARLWEAPGDWNAVCLYSDKVIAAGYAIGTGKGCQVAAFDAVTGRELWRVPVEGNRPNGWDNFALRVHLNHLYLCGMRFDELDPGTGEVLRSASGSGEAWMMGSPVFFGEQAYVGRAHYGYVVDLPAMSSRTLGMWDPGNAYPIWWRGQLYVQGPGNSARALRLNNGKAESVLRVYGYKGTGHLVAPLGGGLLVERDPATGAYLVAYDVVTGEARWRAPMIVESMASGTGELLFIVGEHRLRDPRGRIIPDIRYSVLHALDPKTGRGCWQYRFPDGHRAIRATVPVIADGHVVAATTKGVSCFRGQ